MPDPTTPHEPAPDIERLRAEHPAWHIDTAWETAPSGPDARRLTATREGVRLTAWTAAELTRQIADAERTHGWSR
jgi:hypothetical protein